MKRTCKKQLLIHRGKVFSRGKVKNVKTLYLDNTPIERVDTLTYLGVMLKYNNTFQAAIKHC